MLSNQKAFFVALLAICLCANLSNCVINLPPEPLLHFDPDYLEIGSLVFLPSIGNAFTGIYTSIITVTFTKMNKYTPNDFGVFFGWRGIDIMTQTQSQGEIIYASSIPSHSATSMSVRCNTTKASKFLLLNTNYLLIHQKIKTSQLIIGTHLSSNNPCLGVDPIPSPTICTITASLAVPSTHSRNFISLKSFKMSRADNTALSVYVRFDVIVINTTDISLDLTYAHGGEISFFQVDVLFFDPSLEVEKKNINLQFFTFTSSKLTTATGLSIYASMAKVFDYNFFATIPFFEFQNTQFHYNTIIPTNSTLNTLIYHIGTSLNYIAFIAYGYKCPDQFFLSESTSQCKDCPEFCSKCQLSPSNQLQCITCDPNFLPASDKLSCSCPFPTLNGVCSDFSTPGLNTCTNALITPTGVQCVFCNPNNFQVASNNQCLCKSGYSDFDNDGICTETCGDGIVFDAECDDGNTKSNDGCSSTCTKEPGFVCDYSQLNSCTSQIPLLYKFAFVERIEGFNKGLITLVLKNTLSSLPFDFTADNFKPSSFHVRLFIIEFESPYKEIEIMETHLQDLTTDKHILLEFPYTFTVQNLRARIEIDYSQTRYVNYVQKLELNLKSITKPLIYSENIATFTTISIVLCVGTIIGILGLMIGLLSPKYIGLESLFTLQLVFFSQLLIVNPSKWPVGFMYLKYFKFSSGYNDILILTDFIPHTNSAKKMENLGIKKTIIENFNINFILLGLSFIVFIIVFYLKNRKETQMRQLQISQKASANEDRKNIISLKESINQNRIIMKSIECFQRISEKIFWVVNHFSVWMILPIMSSLAAHLMIGNNLVEQLASSGSLSQQILTLSPIIAVSSSFIITFICMNNFKNTFLSQETINKILLKPEEKTYKSCLVLYLCVFGFLILFFNEVVVYKIPMSMFVFALQVLYTIALVVVHPYRQSLRVHTVTLLINQVVYTVFLAFINLINMVDEIDEILVIMLGYFITGCCGFLMLLTGVRLYYELRYGEALEKKIQKEREMEEERQKKLKEERLEMMKKKLESDAKKKQSQKEIERANNPFLYENQANEDKAKDLMDWLQKCNWQAEVKQKYFFSKFSYKPLDWLKKNNQQEYEKMVKIRNSKQPIIKKILSAEEEQVYSKLKDGLRKEQFRHKEMLKLEQFKHMRKMGKDMNYTMDVMKEERNKFMGHGYNLTD